MAVERSERKSNLSEKDINMEEVQTINSDESQLKNLYSPVVVKMASRSTDRVKRFRSNLSDEEKSAAKEKDRLRKAEKRKKETGGTKNDRLDKEWLRQRQKRAKQTPEEKEELKKKEAERQLKKRQFENSDEKAKREDDFSYKKRRARSLETIEKRNLRLEAERNRQRTNRAKDTSEERKRRKENIKDSKSANEYHSRYKMRVYDPLYGGYAWMLKRKQLNKTFRLRKLRPLLCSCSDYRCLHQLKFICDEVYRRKSKEDMVNIAKNALCMF